MGEVRHVLPQGAGGGGRAARTPAQKGVTGENLGGDTIGGGSANPEPRSYMRAFFE